MANPNYDEGFHVLEDFVCEAIHKPGVPLTIPANQRQIEGLLLLEEIICDASKMPNAPDQGSI